jgi:hypothetical protein
MSQSLPIGVWRLKIPVWSRLQAMKTVAANPARDLEIRTRTDPGTIKGSGTAIRA